MQQLWLRNLSDGPSHQNNTGIKKCKSIRNSQVFRNTPDLIRKFAYLSSRGNTTELADNLRRELYGMNMREQSVIEQVISRAGQAV